MEFGAAMFFTDYSMTPARLAQELEGRDFESVWAPEHSHIPTSRATPFPQSGELPRKYAEAMADHGTAFATRFKLMRERIAAMREIWTKSEAEYHGEFVDFPPMMSWPKPVQTPHPPVIVGGAFPYAAAGRSPSATAGSRTPTGRNM